MIIEDTIIQRTVGNSESTSQYFYKNAIVKPKFPKTLPFEYKIPTFNPSGASFDFYSQNIHAISTNFNNKKILRFNWLNGTSSLSGTNIWRQEIYRLPYDIYEQFLNSTGDTQIDFLNQINSFVNEPLITIDLPASSVTTINGFYDFEIPEIVKPTNSFAEQLFLDKSQYFIDSKLIFNRTINNTIGDFIFPTPFDGEEIIPPLDIENQYVGLNDEGFVTSITASTLGQFKEVISQGKSFQIEQGVNELVTGLTINGAYFVYFVVPQKPNLDVLNGQPSTQGMLDTFSPIFNFNTVDDGDYYRLQINYDINDVSFSGNQRAVFFIDKQPGDPEFIRSFSTPLNPAQDFIYRIGNTKEIINIFDVKQNVTTWSKIVSANTANDGTYNVSGYVYQTYYQDGTPIDPLLGGIPVISSATVNFFVVTNTSAVDLGADVPTDSSILGEVTQSLGGGVGSSFSAITDVNGYYQISNVPGGYNQITVTSPISISGNPIFSSATQLVDITQDVGKNFNLTIYWGFSGITFAEFENYPFI